MPEIVTLSVVFGVALLLVAALAALRRRRRGRDAAGRIDGLLHELARRRAELAAAELERNRFLAAFSHDLKQPMQAINLYVGSLERTLAAAPLVPVERDRATESLLRLKQGIGYMNEVFDSVLDASRLDSGTLDVSAERLHLQAFCERLLSQHRQMAEDLGLRLELRMAGMEEAFVQTDPQLLERILRNFISNAMRYTRQGGIRLRVAQRGALCRISVVDTGAGIAAGMRRKIFEEFTRGDQAAMAVQGVGLGLSIARRLAARIGARVSMRSQLGLGSVFSLDLPLLFTELSDADRIRQQEARVLRELLPQVVVSAPAGTLLLCVDGDPEVAHALQLVAPALGVEVLAAGSASEAIRQLALLNRVPSLLLVDAQLPSEPALQAVARIRDEFNADLPLILCSDEALLAGAGGDPRAIVLHRPFDADRLRDAINRSLSLLR